MAPRRRPRKPRLSRMDAAVDSMIPFGFSEELVRRTVKDLLKEYGGDEGWVFIEEYAYKVLIESILSEQEKHQQEENNQEICAEEENFLMENSFQDERAGDYTVLAIAGPSSGVGELTCSEAANTSSLTNDTKGKDCLPLAERDGGSRKEIALDQTCSQEEMGNAVGNNDGNSRGGVHLDNTPFHSPPPVIPSPPPVKDCLPLAARDGESRKDIGLDQTCSQMEVDNAVGNNDKNSRGGVHLDNTPFHFPPPVIPSPPPVEDCLPLAERDGESRKDIGLNQTCGQMEMGNAVGNNDKNSRGGVHLDSTPFHSPLPVIPSPPPVNCVPTQRCKPCYGWISSDDGNSRGGVHLDSTPFHSPPPVIPSPPPVNGVPTRRRKPRYGWISSDDGNSRGGVHLDSTPFHSAPPVNPSPPPVNGVPTRRRKPRYGWISSDDGNSRGGVYLDNNPFHSPPPVIRSPPPVNGVPTQRRKPCYGWISSDDEDDDFIFLTPAKRLTPPTLSGHLKNLNGGTDKLLKRKTRWDLRPEDV